MDYTAGEGWHDARIVPYGPVSYTHLDVYKRQLCLRRGAFYMRPQVVCLLTGGYGIRPYVFLFWPQAKTPHLLLAFIFCSNAKTAKGCLRPLAVAY